MQNETTSRTTPDRRSLFWVLQLGGWGLFGAAMFVAGLSQWTPAFTIVHKASLTLFGFVLSLGLRTTYLALTRAGTPLPLLAGMTVPLSWGAGALWMAAHNLTMTAYLAWRSGDPGRAFEGFPNFLNAIYYAFVLIAWSALYFGVQAWLDLLEQRERALRAELLAHEARLEALRLQLDPHFLFNTLNAVSTLIAEMRAAEANRMIGRLSDYLRLTLERAPAGDVALDEELALTRRYLDIEQVRFGDRLRVVFDIEPDTETARLPPLILQPLVENAVRHGILPRESGGMMTIAARHVGSDLSLKVWDDGPGADDPSSFTPGIGLTNTRARLTELYGDRGVLTVGRFDTAGFTAEIRLPFEDGAPLSGPE